MTGPRGTTDPGLAVYEEMRAGFSIEVPDRFNPVVDILETWEAEDPGAMALISLGRDGETVKEQTIAELAIAARRFAHVLRESGVEKGDPVFVMLPRVPEWYAAVLGAIRIGAVPMPGPNLLTPKDIAYRVHRADATAIVTDRAGAEKVDAISEALPSVRTRIASGTDVGDGWQPMAAMMEAADGSKADLPADPTAREDPLFVYFTSGTVGLPKMVLHTQEYGLGHVVTARFWHRVGAGDRHWTVSDSGWAKAAWGSLFGQWHERATVVQVALGRPEAGTVLSILSRAEIATFCAPPTLYRLLVQGDLTEHDLASLRHCTSGGEPLNPEVIKRWRDGTGLGIYDGYGQTETTLLVANYPGVEVRPGSMGLPAPGWEIAILDEDRRPAGVGVVGDIAVRVDGVRRPIGLFAEYFRDPEATAKAFVDGWYLTGDRAAQDPSGYLWFEARSDDVITSSAYRIGPFEVESALLEHAAVMESAVVGKPDPQRTQIVCAFVVLASGWTASPELAGELQEHVKRATAPYKYPREIYFVEELPKTVSGKIRRTELREQLAG